MLWGLLHRKERWSLSWRGRFLVLGAAAVLVLVLQQKAHSFLAITSRTSARVLIVDGWTPTYTLPQAAAEFQQGKYQQVLVVRGVYEWSDKYESGRHAGDYVGELLVQQGVPPGSLQTVFCSVVKRDRTYHSAIAVRQWLADHAVAVDAINVATLGPHARRSRLLYEKAFGPEVQVGIIALEDRIYDPDQWWRSSEGVKEVISEAAAYLYVRVFFHPDQNGPALAAPRPAGVLQKSE